MAWLPFPTRRARRRISGPGRKLADIQARRTLDAQPAASPDGRKLYIGVGSLTNIADNGMEAEEGRAPSMSSISPEARAASSLRACATPWAWRGSLRRGVLWTVVNERDGLGDETPPDYLTSVRDGGFYGWPYCYWGQTVDDRVPQDPAMVAKAITPDYALGGHTASLGLCWLPAGRLPGFPGWHGHRTARIVEPQQAERLQALFRAIRERAPGRSAARYSVGVSRAGRTGVLWAAGGGGDRPRRCRADGG